MSNALSHERRRQLKMREEDPERYAALVAHLKAYKKAWAAKRRAEDPAYVERQREKKRAYHQQHKAELNRRRRVETLAADPEKLAKARAQWAAKQKRLYHKAKTQNPKKIAAINERIKAWKNSPAGEAYRRADRARRRERWANDPDYREHKKAQHRAWVAKQKEKGTTKP